MSGTPKASNNMIPEPETHKIDNRALWKNGRRIMLLLLVATSVVTGGWMMFDVLHANGFTLLEGSVLLLFLITFGWITVSFWTAICGCILLLLRRDPLTLKRIHHTNNVDSATLQHRTAVIMPVYNESPERVFDGLEATCQDLARFDQAGAFDFYLLSDTRDPEIARAEESLAADLNQRLPQSLRLYYRRRENNSGRKAGNIAEFCRRWGQYYEHFIVLDADSIVGGAALIRLAQAMEANPRAGIIQSIPLPIGQETLFGRSMQFAARIYGPMLAAGLAFWQTDAANYWGHNAILRTSAFMDHCGLSDLPGRPPLGGEILSHDFVEAGLMRRAGWHVVLLPEVLDSYEEMPSNLLDFVKRDRRWSQGNLQHLRLLFAHGFHPLSRLHFLLGALAYLSSLLWLLILVLSTADALHRAIFDTQFFTQTYQLFPDWPIAKTGVIASLLTITITVLLLPKALGILLTLMKPQERRRFGSGPRIVVSSLVETVLSILVAPLMMTFHAFFVLVVLCGQNVPWAPQSRTGREISLTEALRRTWFSTFVGIVWGTLAWLYTPQFFWWLTPVLAGLVLAVPLVMLTSRVRVGLALRRAGMFTTPEECDPPPVLREFQRITALQRPISAQQQPLPQLPDEHPRAMPEQSFRTGRHWRTSKGQEGPAT